MQKYIVITGILLVIVLGLAIKQAPHEPPVEQPERLADTSSETGPTSSESGNLVIESPTVGALIESPVLVKGSARTFESTFQLQLKNADQAVLVEKTITYDAEETGAFGAFGELLIFDNPKTNTGTIEAFTYSAEDGSVQDFVSIPVTFK